MTFFVVAVLPQEVILNLDFFGRTCSQSKGTTDHLKNFGMLRFEPGAAGLEARTLPPCYPARPAQIT